MLRDCEKAKEIWSLLGVNSDNSFYTSELNKWLEMNIKCRSRYKGEWQCTFVVTLDSSWMARYNYIFQGLSPSSLEIVHIIPYKKHEILKHSFMQENNNHTDDPFKKEKPHK